MIRNLTIFAVLLLLGPEYVFAAEDSLFVEQVVPILQRRCYSCHNAAEPSGGFSLQSADAALTGGDSGAAIEPGDPDASYLLELITPVSGAAEMPKEADPLREEEIAIVRQWIASGADWPSDFQLQSDQVTDTDWWSLNPIVRGEVPDVDVPASARVATPIDAFVIDKLREKGLTLSDEADASTLVRRVFYDLIGLPPTPEELDTWVPRLSSSESPAGVDDRAWGALVDDLLASPRYGERWARHWLDVAHYGDTHGYDKDKLRPNAWPYRDYVIRAFNDDRPFARFIKEQIAGDVLYPEQPELIAATGFLVAGPWDFIGHVEVSAAKMDGRIARNLDRDDMVTNTIQTFTSMTVQCARCHNHKFDPISQEDYYSLQAVFAAIGRNDRPIVTDVNVAVELQSIAEKRDKLAERKRQLEETRRDSTTDSAEIEALTAAIKAVSEQLSELAEKRKKLLESQPHVYAAATHFAPEGNHVPSNGTPADIFVLNRGMIDQLVKQVGPGTLQLPGDLVARFDLRQEHTEGERRVALAEWIADARNPLTWRSIVNRVWLYHFGRGIVNSPNDFGRMGQVPTHPELLDWLAVEFRDGGEWITVPQSLKQLHKLIVTSRVYRQSSAHNEAHAKIDGSNQFYWRANRRRLEAESIRDATLFAAGKLDFAMYGPGFQDFALEQTSHSPQFIYEKYDPADASTHRRSIYRFLPRSQPQPFMQTLDCADPSQQVAKRDETVTAMSALAMLNNQLMLYMAQQMASRLANMHESAANQIDTAFQLTLSRLPSEREQQSLIAHAEEYGLSSACRVILNLNEFVFVD